MRRAPHRRGLLVVAALLASGCRAPEIPMSPALAGQRLDELVRRSGQVLLAPPPNRAAVYAELLDELRPIQPLLDDSRRQTLARVLQARLTWEQHAAGSPPGGTPLGAERLALRLAADGVQDASPASVQAQILSLLGAARQGTALDVAGVGAGGGDLDAALASQPAWQRPLHPRVVLEGWKLLARLAARERASQPASAPAADPEVLLACARALVDVGVHGLGITAAQALGVLEGQAGLDPARAALELQQIRRDPGQATAAALGAQALAQLLTRLRALDPSWDVERLRSATLVSGPLDQLGLQVLERRLLEQARAAAREDAGPALDATP